MLDGDFCSSRRTRQFTTFLGMGLFLGLFLGCGGEPRGRIMGEGEDNLVDARRLGAAGYDIVVDKALNELFMKWSANQAGAIQKLKVVYMGLDNRTNEELGSWRDQINAIISNQINAAGSFIDIDYDLFVKPALREAGVGPKDLVIPKNFRAFAQVLERRDRPLDFLLFAQLTQGNTRAGPLRQSDYLLTLTLLNPETGVPIKAAGDLRKEYTR